MGESQVHLTEEHVGWENIVASIFGKRHLVLSGKVKINDVQ
jgi:hypothetical protein